MQQESQTYTTRRAAVQGAKRALAKGGIEQPLSDVHFVIRSSALTAMTHVGGDPIEHFTWHKMDLKTGLPEGEEPPEPPPASVAAEPQEPAAAPAQGRHEPVRQDQAPVSVRPPRWASPKSEPAGKVAYQPKLGTTQDAIYQMLKDPAGVDIEHFCAEMNKQLRPGVIPWSPSNTWSSLRYLFCAGKGYGLRFDGRLLFLVIPRDERPAPGRVKPVQLGGEEGQ